MAVYSYNRSLFDGNNALDESIDLVSESYLDSCYMLENLIDYEIDEMFIESGVYITEGTDGKAVEQSDDSKPSEDKKEENNEKKKTGIWAKIKEFFEKILNFFRSFGNKVEEKAKEINIADKALYEKYHVQVEKLNGFKWKHKYININKYDDFKEILEDIHQENTSKKNDVSKRSHTGFIGIFIGHDAFKDYCKKATKIDDGDKDKLKVISNDYYSRYGMTSDSGSEKDDEPADLNLLEEGENEKELKIGKNIIRDLNSIMSDGQGSELRQIKHDIAEINKKIDDVKEEMTKDLDTSNSAKLAQYQEIQKMTTRTHKYLSRAVSEATKLCSQVYTLRRKLYIAMGRNNLEDAGDTTGEDDNWDESKGSTEKKSDIKEKQSKKDKNQNESTLYEDDLEDVAGDDEDIDPDDAYNDAEEAIDACGDTDTEESCLDLAFGF